MREGKKISWAVALVADGSFFEKLYLFYLKKWFFWGNKNWILISNEYSILFLWTALLVIQGGHWTTLICQKMYIYTCKIYIYTHTKLTYFDNPNENIDHPHLSITKT